MYRTQTQTQGGAAAQMTLILLLGGLLALGAATMFLLLGAAAVSAGWLSEDRSVQLTAAACVLGCFLGGGYTCRHWSTRKLLAGLGVGVVCFLLILTVSLFLEGGWNLGAQGMIELAGCLCGGAAAGFLCRKQRKGKKKSASRRPKRT